MYQLVAFKHIGHEISDIEEISKLDHRYSPVPANDLVGQTAKEAILNFKLEK